MIGTVVLILVLLVIFAAVLVYLERILASKPERMPGMILPGIFFLMALFSIVGSAPAVIAQTFAAGGSIWMILLVDVITFVFMNIPTALVYVVYYRTRRKMGETHPWPFRQKK